jgi:hypothetical protein
MTESIRIIDLTFIAAIREIDPHAEVFLHSRPSMRDELLVMPSVSLLACDRIALTQLARDLQRAAA